MPYLCNFLRYLLKNDPLECCLTETYKINGRKKLCIRQILTRKRSRVRILKAGGDDLGEWH